MTHPEHTEHLFKGAQYDVDSNNIIRSPGKFEGEMRYVPYFWDQFLMGCCDRDDGKVIGFDLTPEDKERFPELKNRRTVKLYQRDVLDHVQRYYHSNQSLN